MSVTRTSRIEGRAEEQQGVWLMKNMCRCTKGAQSATDTIVLLAFFCSHDWIDKRFDSYATENAVLLEHFALQSCRNLVQLPRQHVLLFYKICEGLLCFLAVA